MLTNKELKDINKIIIDLIMLETYAETLPTGTTPDDIKNDINILENIQNKAKIQKKKNSEKANAWNKAHPKRHNEINKRYNKRKREEAETICK